VDTAEGFLEFELLRPVVGEKRPFVAALITLDAEMLPGWLRNHGLPEMDVVEAIGHVETAQGDRPVKDVVRKVRSALEERHAEWAAAH